MKNENHRAREEGGEGETGARRDETRRAAPVGGRRRTVRRV
jgi:hypothetical protein